MSWEHIWYVVYTFAVHDWKCLKLDDNFWHKWMPVYYMLVVNCCWCFRFESTAYWNSRSTSQALIRHPREIELNGTCVVNCHLQYVSYHVDHLVLWCGWLTDGKGIEPINIMLLQFPEVYFLGHGLTWSDCVKIGRLKKSTSVVSYIVH